MNDYDQLIDDVAIAMFECEGPTKFKHAHSITQNCYRRRAEAAIALLSRRGWVQLGNDLDDDQIDI